MALSRLTKSIAGGLVVGVVAVGVMFSTGGGMVPAAGLPSNCQAGERPESDGAGGWTCRFSAGNDYRGTTLEWTNECLFAGGDGEYTQPATGTGSIVNSLDGQGRPGICDLQTGTTSTGATRVAHSGFGFTLSTLSSFYFQAVVGVPVLSTSTERYALAHGCRDTSGSVDQNNGCYFLYDEGNVAAGGCNTGNLHKWSAVCANNGTRTRVLLDGTSQNGSCGAGSIATVDSPVEVLTLPNTNIYDLEIVGTPSSIDFKINGTTRATITTNIPSAIGRFCADSVAMIKSVGTANRSAYMDRIAARITMQAPRSP